MSFVRVVIICLASTHTALVSSPSLAVLHLSAYLYLHSPLLKIPVWWRRAVLPSLPWVVCFLSFFLAAPSVVARRCMQHRGDGAKRFLFSAPPPARRAIHKSAGCPTSPNKSLDAIPHQRNSFELFGYDVLIDEQNKNKLSR